MKPINNMIYTVVIVALLSFSGAQAGNLRRELGTCGWGCANGRYRSWWDKIRRYCTCDNNWEGRCCDSFQGACAVGMIPLCDQSRLEQRDYPITEMLGQNNLYQGPITLGTSSHGLPRSLQGIFWLQNQGESSSLVSFAPSRDGAGLSSFNAGSNRQISVRVGGDKVWSFASQGRSWELVEGIDLVYHFEGTPRANPTHFNILPEARNLGITLEGDALEFALNFEMDFIPVGSMEHDYPAVGERPAAVQWARPSSIVGINQESAYYEIAQIFDGSGQPTSAYEAWLAYNVGSEEWQDGKIYYHESV